VCYDGDVEAIRVACVGDEGTPNAGAVQCRHCGG
jgi:hypothetical protein